MRRGNLKDTNRVLEAKILGFRTIIKNWNGFLEDYDEYFEIKTMRRDDAS